MSRYTVTVRQLLQNHFDLGLKDYPIYQEEHREVLNNKILNHYLMSEIGQETPELFKIYLNNTMNEIMPKYNILYKALDQYLESDNLLGNVNVKTTEIVNGTNSQTNSGTDTTKSHISQQNKSIKLDTPQGMLSNQDIDEATIYATEVDMNKVTANGEDNKTETVHGLQVAGTNNSSREVHTIGNNGSKYSLDVLMDIQNKLDDIDLSIIKELQPLFFGLY